MISISANCNPFLEYIDSEQADLPYDLALADLQKITDQCLKLLISPVGTYFEHPPEEDEAHEQPKEQTDPLTELAKIVRSTIKNRLMN